MTVAGIDLSDTAFWGLPLAERASAFALLRAQGPQFYAEPEVPFSEKGPGYYALVRYADVAEASRHPEVFCSGRGATNIADLPAEFNEYFGSMINMDDPRHARLRRIVSRAFSPRMIAKFEADVRRAATAIVDDLLVTGPCDFVPNVSARLPLKIICDMTGIPDDRYEMVLANTNIILSGSDPEFLSEDLDVAVTQILGAGQALADLVTGLAAARAQAPAGRPGLGPGDREHRRGAADQCRARLVFHPAGRGRQRDHPHRALARADAAHRVPRAACAASGRPFRPGSKARSRRSSGTPRRSSSCGAP